MSTLRLPWPLSGQAVHETLPGHPGFEKGSIQIVVLKIWV